MQFSTISILLLSSASGLMALPSESTNPSADYVELSRTQVEGGALVVFADMGEAVPSPAASAEPKVEKREVCPASQTIECDNKNNLANQDTCHSLVDSLAQYSTRTYEGNPRQVCYEGDTDKWCCVSWSKSVAGLTGGDLYEQANALLGTCNRNAVSGRAVNTGIRGQCMSVCLSSRGTKCV